jgi:hypothetical protein
MMNPLQPWPRQRWRRQRQLSFSREDHCTIFSWDWIAGEVAGRKAWVKIWVAMMTTVVGVDGGVQEENTKMGGSTTQNLQLLGRVGFTHLRERDNS